MVLMRLREVSACARHARTLVVLEDVTQSRCLTFYADCNEAARLAQALARGPRACHPVYDFLRELCRALGAAPKHVLLEDVEGHGIGALVFVQRGETNVPVTCYPPDALAVALREGLPIYATDAALGHAEPVPEPEPGSASVAQWLDGVRPRDFEA